MNTHACGTIQNIPFPVFQKLLLQTFLDLSVFTGTGTVADGKKLGRSLGYPTLNLQFPKNKILPRLGVYSSVTVIGDDTYNSITNVGRRPSVDDGDEVNIETFIYDFNDDIYGREVSVKLTHFLRDERRFESLEALKDQIAIDIDEASKYQ